MSGACFQCGSPAERAIYTDTPTPAGHVCTACDQRAVIRHRQLALELVEEAQRTIGRAAEQLSPVLFGDPAHTRLRKLYERIHDEWYRLRDDRHRSRWSMDDIYWTARFKEAKR